MNAEKQPCSVAMPDMVAMPDIGATPDISGIFKENERLIWNVLHKYGHGLSEEEKEQCGYMGVWKATKNFDESKCKFTSRLYDMVKWECLMDKRQNAKQTRDMVCSGIMDDMCEQCSTEESHELSNRLVDMRFRRGLTWKEIGLATGNTLDVARARTIEEAEREYTQQVLEW